MTSQEMDDAKRQEELFNPHVTRKHEDAGEVQLVEGKEHPPSVTRPWAPRHFDDDADVDAAGRPVTSQGG